MSIHKFTLSRTEGTVAFAQARCGGAWTSPGRTVAAAETHGDLDRPFLGAKKPNTVSGWEVANLADEIKIAGAPIAGMGVGAELRVYPSGSTADVVLDPKKSKATLKVSQTDGITVTHFLIEF